MFLDNTLSFVKTLKSEILTAYSGDLNSAVIAIISLAMIFAIGNIVYPSLVRNQPIDFYALIKPFLIGLIAMNLNVFIVMMDKVFVWMEEKAKSEILVSGDDSMFTVSTSKDNSFIFKPEEEAIANMGVDDVLLGKGYDDRGVLMTAGAAAATGARNRAVELVDNTDEMTNAFAVSLFNACYVAFMILQQVYLTVLSLLGPFAVAMAIFPMFSDNFSSWLGRYISIGLWGPLAVILKTFFQNIYAQAGIGNGDWVSSAFDVVLSSLLMIGCALLFFRVPTLAGMAIQSSGGMGSLQGGVSQLMHSGADATGGDIKHKLSGISNAGKGMASEILKYKTGGGGLKEALKGQKNMSWKDAFDTAFKDRFEDIGGYSHHMQDLLLNKGDHSKKGDQLQGTIASSLRGLGYSKYDAYNLASLLRKGPESLSQKEYDSGITAYGDSNDIRTRTFESDDHAAVPGEDVGEEIKTGSSSISSEEIASPKSESTNGGGDIRNRTLGASEIASGENSTVRNSTVQEEESEDRRDEDIVSSTPSSSESEEEKIGGSDERKKLWEQRGLSYKLKGPYTPKYVSRHSLSQEWNDRYDAERKERMYRRLGFRNRVSATREVMKEAKEEEEKRQK